MDLRCNLRPALLPVVVARNEDLLAMLRQHDEQMERIHRMNGRSHFAYSSIEGFVLAHGQKFDHLSKRAQSFKRGRLKACFWNSRVLAGRARGLTYVEGYALSVKVPIMPIHHAWTAETPLRVALVRATPEEILRDMAVRTKHGDVIALWLPQESPVEVACVVSVDAEGTSMFNAVLLDVVNRQELERAFSAAGTRTAVKLDHLQSRLTSALSHVGAIAGAGLFGFTLPLSACPELLSLSTDPAALESFVDRTDPASRTYLFHAGDYSIHSNGVSNTFTVVTGRASGVVDVTWWDPGVAYIGCPFPIEYVRYSQTEDNTSVIDQWQKGYPLLMTRNKYEQIIGRKEQPCKQQN